MMNNPRSKPFSLHLSKKFIPEKTAKDYSEAELLRFEEEFKPIAENCIAKVKRLENILNACFVCFALCVVLAAAGIRGILLGLVFAIPISLFLILFISIIGAKVFCPACKGNLGKGLGEFCPECGGQMKRSGILKRAECGACGFRPKYGTRGSRQFKIRCCPYCGIKLYERGF